MHRIRFAEFELDLHLFQLKRGGQDIGLRRGALDLLAFLISNRMQVVTPEMLRLTVWGGASLCQSAIATCLSDLRRALHDDPADPRFIETVRSRGYCFMHPVEVFSCEPERIPSHAGRIPLPFVAGDLDLEDVPSLRPPLERAPKSSPSQHGRLLLEYARARLYSGERNEARAMLLEAAAIARAIRSVELLADCALQIAPDFLSIEMGVYDATLVELIEEALDLVSQSETALRAQLLARLCQAMRWATPPADATLQDLADRALSAAKASGDGQALYAALEARADALHGPDRVVEKLATIRALMHHGGSHATGPAILRQHIRHVAGLLELGDTAALDPAIEACDEAARDLNLSQYLWYPIAFRAARALMQGDLARADALGDRFTRIGSNTRDRNVAASRACQSAVLHLENDQAQRAISISSDFIVRFPSVRAWSAGLALLCIHTRNRRKAMRILGEFDEGSARSLFRETGGSAGAAFLAQLSIAVSDSGLMTALYDLFAPVGPRGATLGLGTTYFGCFARYSGLLAHALGLHAEAIEHLRTAISIETERSAILYRAHAQIDLALVLAASAGPAIEAHELIRSAAEAATARGLPRVQRRIGPALGALRKIEGHGGRRRAGPPGP